MCLANLLNVFLDGFEDLSLTLSALEGLVGCGPQIVFQLVAVLSMGPPDLLQILVLVFCLVSIGRTVVQYDVLFREDTNTREIEIGCVKACRYSMLASPIYLTSLLFRIGMFAILIGYLKHFAVLPIILHLFILCSVARLLKFKNEDIFLLGLTNSCSMSVGPLKSAESSIRQSRFKFMFYSSLGSFIVLTAFLVCLMVAINLDSNLMSHWNTLLLSNCGSTLAFNIVSCFVIEVGLVNVVLLGTSQWGRLYSYLDREDMEDIMDIMRNQYRSGNVSFILIFLNVTVTIFVLNGHY